LSLSKNPLLFLSGVHFVWQAWDIRGILTSKTLFCVTGAWDAFASVWQAWRFLHLSTAPAGMGQNERWFWRSFFAAGAVFGEFGRRFERVESCIL